MILVQHFEAVDRVQSGGKNENKKSLPISVRPAHFRSPTSNTLDEHIAAKQPSPKVDDYQNKSPV